MRGTVMMVLICTVFFSGCVSKRPGTDERMMNNVMGELDRETSR